MLTSCLGADQVRAFLADELPAAQEGELGRHIDACPGCQALVEQLSEDPQARQMQAEHRRRRTHSPPQPEQLDELRERLHVLGWFAGTESEGNGSTLAAPPSAVAGDWPAVHPAAAEAPATCVGKFQVIQPIGAGGFGVVFLARDQVLHRQVALKLARTSVLADPDLQVRFLREAEALARLAHPHIVPVYEAGEHAGTCYLAVGYCDGPTLEQWLCEQEGGVAPRLAADIACKLAQAIEHAHQHGILHRDIKPSNILLDRSPGDAEGPLVPTLPFVPKLTDFGLAKIAEQPSQTTISGTLLGTPQYMAPEQAAGMVERTGPATDVYALGAVLYELLTGRPPICGANSVDTLRRVLIDEPTPPRQLAPAVPDDLDAIVLKCLDKSPSRRYSTAAELAADLERFQSGRPTLARPLTPAQRSIRWVRRNPAAAAVLGLVALVLMFAGGMFFFERELAALQRATERQLAQRAYCDDIVAAAQQAQAGNLSGAQPLLEKHIPAAGGEDLRSYEWHYLWSQITHDDYAQYDAGADVFQLRAAPDGKRLALACQDGSLRLLDAGTLARRAVFNTPKTELNGVGWSSDGRLVAAAYDDGSVRIWDVQGKGTPRILPVHPGKVFGVAFFDGDTKLVTCGEDPVVRLWDVATGRSAGTLVGHQREVEAMAIAPAANVLATAGSDRHAILWSLDDGQMLADLPGHRDRLSSIAFSPDGLLVATGCLDCAVRLWSVPDGAAVGEAIGLDGIQSVAFNRAGDRLIVGDRGGTVRSYRLVPQQPPQAGVDLRLDTADDAWQAHEGKVWSLASLADGERFVSSGRDLQVRAWGRGLRDRRRLDIRPDQAQSAGFNRDGSLAFVLGHDGGVQAYDSADLAQRFKLAVPGQQFGSLAVLVGREQVAAGTEAGQIVLWNWKSKSELHRWQIPGGTPVDRLIYSPAAHLLAAISYRREDLLLFQPDTGNLVASLAAPSCTDAAFSPDGRRLVVDTLNKLAIYDLRTFHLLHTAAGHTNTVESLAYSPDERLIASASGDRSLRLWTTDGQPVESFRGHLARLTAVLFTPDGRSLVCGDSQGRIKVYHVASRRELLDFPSGLSGVQRLAISPDGQRLIVVGTDGDVAVLGPPMRPTKE